MPFRDVIGHRRVVELLARSVARESLPPSLMFAGPAGSGKRLTAVALAQALNCEHPVRHSGTVEGSFPVDACGTCPACTRIARGVHPDVMVLEPGENGSIKIEQVRDAIDQAGYRPFEGKRRVVVIDDADALVPHAQNALLKTLEEPPASTVFVLVTARPDALLPTVRSRCIRLWFAQGATPAVDDEAREIARRVLAHAKSTRDPGRLIEGAKVLLTGTGSKAAEDRARVSAYLRAIASLLRDVELVATRADRARLANTDAQQALEQLAPAFGGARGVRAFAAVDGALAALERNVGIKSIADWLVLEL